MIVGSVHPAGEAVVPIRVRGPASAPVELQVVVDTGFNDWLTLCKVDIEKIGLVFREEARYLLADGSESVSRLFAAEVEWHGKWRRILVVEIDGGPLIGMALMHGCYLGVEVIDGGRVEIKPLA